MTYTSYMFFFVPKDLCNNIFLIYTYPVLPVKVHFVYYKTSRIGSRLLYNVYITIYSKDTFFIPLYIFISPSIIF